MLTQPDSTQDRNTFLKLGYLHLVHDDLWEYETLRAKFDAGKVATDDEEALVRLSNGHVLKAYLEEKLAGRTEIRNAEAIEILKSENINTWEIPDKVALELVQFSPLEDDL